MTELDISYLMYVSGNTYLDGFIGNICYMVGDMKLVTLEDDNSLMTFLYTFYCGYIKYHTCQMYDFVM